MLEVKLKSYLRYALNQTYLIQVYSVFASINWWFKGYINIKCVT